MRDDRESKVGRSSGPGERCPDSHQAAAVFQVRKERALHPGGSIGSSERLE